MQQQTQIAKLLAENGIVYTASDIETITELASQFTRQGYPTNALGVAQFICQDKQQERAKEVGLSTYLDTLKYVKLKPITAPKLPQRNQPCICGSGKKYKKCCLTKKANL